MSAVLTIGDQEIEHELLGSGKPNNLWSESELVVNAIGDIVLKS